MLYDFMIKEILNQETAPERLNELLSLLLEKKVRIASVLPNETTRIADESPFEKAQKNSAPIPGNICTAQRKNWTRDCNWNYCKNISAYHLIF